MEPLFRGHPDEKLLDNVNLNINVFISTPDERPPLLKGHFSVVLKSGGPTSGVHILIIELRIDAEFELV